MPATILLEFDGANATNPPMSDVYINLVPEPCSMALFGAGVGVMGIWRRKRVG
jgi:hypothetical protein